MKAFEPASIGTLHLKNRIIRSATHEGMSDEKGYPRRDLTDLYVRLAKGEAGAIITGVVAVQANGRLAANQAMFHGDEYIQLYQETNAELQEYGTPLVLQIGHAGANTLMKVTGHPAVAPSPYKWPLNLQYARALTEEEIQEVIESFVQAIIRAKKARFEAVELHAAHGYLLHQFLSPRTNRRVDGWGGSTKNRFRIVKEIVQRARDKVGDYPILVKHSAYDYEKSGISLDEGVTVAELMQEVGVDAVEVSCGGILGAPSAVRWPRFPIEAMMEYTPQLKALPVLKRLAVRSALKLSRKARSPLHTYNVPAAERIKRNVHIPVIVTGGIRRLSEIEDIIGSDRADFVSLCRPFVIEPNIVQKLRSGQQAESRCINCGYCLFGVASNGLRCYYGKLRRSGNP